MTLEPEEKAKHLNIRAIYSSPRIPCTLNLAFGVAHKNSLHRLS